MIEVVGVFVAAGNGEHARAQNVGHRMGHQERIARVGDQPRQPFGDANSPLGGG
jgi:hypothetical protein